MLNYSGFTTSAKKCISVPGQSAPFSSHAL